MIRSPGFSRSRSFLTDEEWQEALLRFEPVTLKRAARSPHPQATAFSSWLEECLMKRLSQLPEFERAGPVALGSFARGELCPRSDVDLILLGETTAAGAFVAAAQAAGIKVRARQPEDRCDLTKGVEMPDVLALEGARPLSELAAPLWREAAFEIKPSAVRDLLRRVRRERRDRERRHLVFGGGLEPNIKHGPGGLRDVEQALAITRLIPGRWTGAVAEEALMRLRQGKQILLSLRQALHLAGFAEVLVAEAQPDLAKVFGFDEPSAFMTEVQRWLQDLSFYANWVIAAAASTPRRRSASERSVGKTLGAAFRALEKDSSLLVQAALRTQVSSPERGLAASAVGRLLRRHFRLEQSSDWFQAVIDSHLLMQVLPDWERVRGLVQNDQYHRFTVDRHLLRIILEVHGLAARTLFKRRGRVGSLGRLQKRAERLRPRDWQILLWASLFHDLAKGRGGDHSNKGAVLAESRLSAFGFPKSFTTDVRWLVQEHLTLSGAAFRRNHQSPSTWRDLSERGIRGRHLDLLVVLTAADIRATNPDAWNDWKEDMLYRLAKQLDAPGVTEFSKWLQRQQRRLTRADLQFFEALDPALWERFPAAWLLADQQQLIQASGNLKPLVRSPIRGRSTKGVTSRSNVLWVRFHSREDRPGLFAGFVAQLYGLGCQVQEAWIQTIPGFGAYDWFQVRTRLRASVLEAQLQRRVATLDMDKGAPAMGSQAIHFDKIEVISREGDEAILSFRGPDQPGALLAVAQALYARGLGIRFARVLTWGRQIDDVFGVHGPHCDWDELARSLLNRDT